MKKYRLKRMPHFYHQICFAVSCICISSACGGQLPQSSDGKYVLRPDWKGSVLQLIEKGDGNLQVCLSLVSLKNAGFHLSDAASTIASNIKQVVNDWNTLLYEDNDWNFKKPIKVVIQRQTTPCAENDTHLSVNVFENSFEFCRFTRQWDPAHCFPFAERSSIWIGPAKRENPNSILDIQMLRHEYGHTLGFRDGYGVSVQGWSKPVPESIMKSHRGDFTVDDVLGIWAIRRSIKSRSFSCGEDGVSVEQSGCDPGPGGSIRFAPAAPRIGNVISLTSCSALTEGQRCPGQPVFADTGKTARYRYFGKCTKILPRRKTLSCVYAGRLNPLYGDWESL